MSESIDRRALRMWLEWQDAMDAGNEQTADAFDYTEALHFARDAVALPDPVQSLTAALLKIQLLASNAGHTAIAELARAALEQA